MVRAYIGKERMSSYWLVVYSVTENLINGCWFVIKEGAVFRVCGGNENFGPPFIEKESISGSWGREDDRS